MRLSEFAKRLGVSIHTAKRRLNSHGDYRRLAKIELSSGKHWSVMLNKPDAIRYLRISECFGRILKRRPGLQAGFPRLGGADWLEGWGNSKMAFNDDLAGFMADLQDEMPDLDFAKFDDEQLCKLISYFWLIRACQNIQKQKKKLTVKMIADALGVSLAALYRRPFGFKTLRAAINRVEGEMPSNAASVENAAAFQDGLHKPRKSRTRDSRAGYFRQRRMEAKYCYLAWLAWGDEHGGLRTVHLRCFFETPREGPKGAEMARRRWRQNKVMTAFEIAERLARQFFQSQIMDGENIARIIKRIEGDTNVRWQVGTVSGVCTSFPQAIKAIERIVAPHAHAPRFVVLNPQVGRRYLIPGVVHFASFMSKVFPEKLRRPRTNHPA